MNEYYCKPPENSPHTVLPAFKSMDTLIIGKKIEFLFAADPLSEHHGVAGTSLGTSLPQTVMSGGILLFPASFVLPVLSYPGYVSIPYRS